MQPKKVALKPRLLFLQLRLVKLKLGGFLRTTIKAPPPVPGQCPARCRAERAVRPRTLLFPLSLEALEELSSCPAPASCLVDQELAQRTFNNIQSKTRRPSSSSSGASCRPTARSQAAWGWMKQAGSGCWWRHHRQASWWQVNTRLQDWAQNRRSADKRVTDSSEGSLVDDLKPGPA